MKQLTFIFLVLFLEGSRCLPQVQVDVDRDVAEVVAVLEAQLPELVQVMMMMMMIIMMMMMSRALSTWRSSPLLTKSRT